jgi:hypothetical protein
MNKSQIIAGMAKEKKGRSWPDSSPTEMGEDWDDNIGKDGTDYSSQKIGKSFAEHAAEHPVLIEGAEVSPFLNDLLTEVSKSFEAFEGRMTNVLHHKYIESAEFDKSLGEAVLDIGHGVNDVSNRCDYLDESVGGIVKSLPGQSLGNVSFLDRPGLTGASNQPPSQEAILDAMVKGVEAGQIDPLEVIRYESTKQLSPEIAKSLGLDGGN